jgi:RimJ/RimL family protein N-acetyltransferase
MSLASLTQYWPLFGLRITTPRLVLRPPTDDDYPGLIAAIHAGIHDPATQPFAVPWTDVASPQLEQNSLQHWWSSRANWQPNDWTLPFAVFLNGDGIGYQSLHAKHYPLLRTAETGSWLAQPWQAHGLGTEMRHAVVQFAFEYLDAQSITSGAFADNLSSQRVSLAVGYEPNGIGFAERRGVIAEQRKFLLTRERWQQTRADIPIDVTGFDECRVMFGLD